MASLRANRWNQGEKSMTEITIRPESFEDLRGIDIVNIAAFEEEDEARLVTAIRHSPAYIPQLSLVAEGHNRILGHLMMFKALLEREEEKIDILALAPMSVLPSHSHRGIGSRLVTSALQQAREQAFPGIVVAGYPDYYARFGFEPAFQKGVECNLPVEKEAILVLELAEGTFDHGGRIVYPALFRQFYQTPH